MKIPKIKKIREITKYLKDQNLTREPKISNILNIFLKFEILSKTWNYSRKRESKIYNNIFILRTYINYSNIHNMNKTFWVLWIFGVQQRPACPKKSNRYFFSIPNLNLYFVLVWFVYQIWVKFSYLRKSYIRVYIKNLR